MTKSAFLSVFIAASFAVVFFVCYVAFFTDSHASFASRRIIAQGVRRVTFTPDDSLPAKIIHQSWKTHNLPKRFQKWQASWRRCYPDWEIRLWNDTENRAFISEHYPWFLKYYDKFTWNIHRVDSARYFYLFHYGGLYTDLDNECLKPFPHLLQNYSLVFGAMNGQYASFIKEGYVQNSLMYSRPRHPFWLEMIHEVMNRVKSTAPPEAVAGPITLVHTINEYRKRHTQDIKIYPPDYFNPNSWLKARSNGCKDFNKMTEAEEQQCKQSHNTSYVIQYHTQTWARGKVER